MVLRMRAVMGTPFSWPQLFGYSADKYYQNLLNYPLDNSIDFDHSYPMDIDLCAGLRCPIFELPGASGPFLESPETFRANFRCHNSLCIFKTKASRCTKLLQLF